MPDQPSPFDAAPGWFVAVFVLVALVVAAGIVFSVGSGAYRAQRMARRGQNPLTIREDLAHQASRSHALAPERTKADRLAELDRMLADGTVSQAERDEARSRILAE